ncbi:hypothetical protein DRJ22_03375 [Candidatus Woesearchaeota archaeon]|nr:MAG: hypothetical protein DRJ22_03375 [Candidatus Woesearchaeota archaeon]
MNRIWFAIFVLLVLGIAAGFLSKTNPTNALVVNLPPVWDYAADVFFVDDVFTLNLNSAFYDPDGDSLAFSIHADENIVAGISGNELVAKLNSDSGEVLVSASDGISSVEHRIVLKKKK